MADENRKRVIGADSSQWKLRTDLYDAVLPLLGAPEWHGANMNALTGSIVWGEINTVEPPYTLRIRGTANLPPGVSEELGWLEEDVACAHEEFHGMFGRDVDVDVELLR